MFCNSDSWDSAICRSPEPCSRPLVMEAFYFLYSPFPYSPECVEVEFSEVRHNGVLGSWLQGSAGGIMLTVERARQSEAGRRRQRNGSVDAKPPLSDLFSPRVRSNVGGVGAPSARRPARHRGDGVDLGPGHCRTTRSSPYGWARCGEGARGALGALARRLAVVSSGHPRACCLLTPGSGDLCGAWWLLGSRGTTVNPRGTLVTAAPFLGDTDPHRRLRRGARLAGFRAPSSAHPIQRPGGQLDPRRDLGAVAPAPRLGGGERNVPSARLAAPRGHNSEVGPLYLGFPAHPRKRSNRHAVSWGDQPIHRLAGRG